MAPTSKPPSRQEQRELDELLSDIYKGIEKLPDTNGRYVQVAVSPSQTNARDYNNNNHSRHLLMKSSRREYELPASSPLVQEYKRDIAALTAGNRNNNKQQVPQQNSSRATPLHSSLKRETPEAHAQSLGSFMSNSLTPENRRRVRILEDRPGQRSERQATGKVKQVNTNKFIYHQERNPDDDADLIDYVDDGDDYAADENDLDFESSSGNNNFRGGRRSTRAANSYQATTNAPDDYDDDDLDGVTRVEYYHTSWLDRQLGRAHRRRNSKELNERQVKEKAMIEELKRNLKNGAITLRRSLKGSGSRQQQQQNKQATSKSRRDNSHLFEAQDPTGGRVLTPAPLNRQPQERSERYYSPASNTSSTQAKSAPKRSILAPSQQSNQSMNRTIPASSSSYHNNQIAATRTPPKQVTTTITSSRVDPQSNPYSSRTLPHSYQQQQYQPQAQVYSDPPPPPPTQQQQTSTTQRHQLIQQHARAGSNLQRSAASPHRNYNTLGPNYLASQSANTNAMRNPNYSSNTIGPSHNSMMNKQLQQAPNMTGANQQHQETISSLPSATNVVRSALSRSSSQVSLNQLNKTINMIPETPPGTRNNVCTPMTPTQTLKAASPSLSPSPVAGSPAPRVTSPNYSSKTMPSPGNRQQQQQQQQYQQTQQQSTLTRLHGTRIIEPKPNPTAQQQLTHQPYRYQPQSQPQQQQQQPVYANPHASLMQHRMEQQMRQLNKNVASIREFNELDSLLRSLSPRGTSSTSVTPGYSSRPTQASFGGYMPANSPAPAATNRGQTAPGSSASDVYARVQKQQPATGNYLQQHQGSNIIAANVTQPLAHNEPFVIDVTDKNKEVDENCMRRPQNVSEFEPPVELLPSMEDYQNISKLNPVKNHYWYKPNMSRDRAIGLLKDKPQGTFIVRDSTSFRGAYGLAVKVSKLPKNVLNNASLRNSTNSGDPSAELIRHFLIEPTSNGVRLKGYANEPVFGSLPSLIYQHSLTELALPCKLVIPRADIEDPNFNHKQKRFFDEFLASKEQAKHAPYERTSPNGGYRKYPGDVYVHNEHRIIFQ